MHLSAGQVFQAIFTLYWIDCRADTKSSPVYVTFPFRNPVRAAQHRSVIEIAPKSPFLCVNLSPIQYGLVPAQQLSGRVRTVPEKHALLKGAS